MGVASVDLSSLPKQTSQGTAEFLEELSTQGHVALRCTWDHTSGALSVELLRGTGLAPMDLTGFSDPYVVLELNGQRCYLPCTEH